MTLVSCGVLQCFKLMLINLKCLLQIVGTYIDG